MGAGVEEENDADAGLHGGEERKKRSERIETVAGLEGAVEGFSDGGSEFVVGGFGDVGDDDVRAEEHQGGQIVVEHGHGVGRSRENKELKKENDDDMRFVATHKLGSLIKYILNLEMLAEWIWIPGGVGTDGKFPFCENEALNK